MHGDGYETRQVPLFHVFVRIFGFDPAQNTFFLEMITNQILRINYAQLICKLVRSENKKILQGHGQFNIDCHNIVLAAERFKVS